MFSLDSLETRDMLLPLIWCGWMVVAPAGPILGWIAYKRWPTWPGRVRTRVVIISGAFLIASLSMATSSWSLRSFIAASLLVAVGYISFCELTWLIACAKPKKLTVIAPILSTMFAIAMVIFVYTGLGFLFVVGDMIPTKNTELGNHFVLHMTEGGGATAAHNYATLKLAKRSPWIPDLEHTVYDRFVQDDECDSHSLHISISDNASHGEVLCGGLSIDNFSIPHY